MIATTRGLRLYAMRRRGQVVVLFLLLLLSDRRVVSSASSIPSDRGDTDISSSVVDRAGGYDDISNRITQVQAEILQLTKKGAKQTLNFENKIKSINAKARKDISDADFYSCTFTDAPCLYQCIKKLKQAERKLQRRIIRAKENREKSLSKHKLDLEAKERELSDLQRSVGVDVGDVQGGPGFITTNHFEIARDQPTELKLMEIDYSLKLLKSSTRMDANCTINGLTTDDLLENEWEKLIEMFQAIVNLGYVHNHRDRIYLNDEVASSNRRNLRLRKFFGRGSRGTCGGCRNIPIHADDAPQNNVDALFVKFVNEYLAGVITSIVPPNRIAPNTLIEVSCMFTDVYG